MVYTVTLNPSLDYIADTKAFQLGKTNRTIGEELVVGGKGINVSVILNNLMVPNVALGFISGFVGAEIEKQLRTMGITTDFSKLESGNSRINIKLKEMDGTEINGRGPQIYATDIENLVYKLEKTLCEGDVLVLGGSVPKGAANTVYVDIIKMLKNKNVKLVVDTSGETLKSVLKLNPFLIKPNVSELCEVFNTEIQSQDEVIEYAKLLKKSGALNVMVSMSEKGAVMVSENGDVFRLDAPKGKLVNSVGAGDSMVGGFIAAYLESGDYAKAFKTGVAAGSATAFSAHLAQRDEIYKLYEKIKDREILRL